MISQNPSQVKLQMIQRTHACASACQNILCAVKPFSIQCKKPSNLQTYLPALHMTQNRKFDSFIFRSFRLTHEECWKNPEGRRIFYIKELRKNIVRTTLEHKIVPKQFRNL